MNKTPFMFLAILLLTGCDKTPTGRDQLALVPASMMAQFGSQAFLQMQQQIPASENATSNARVQCIAREILLEVGNRFPGTPMPNTWEIVLFDDPAPNAFALPGGKIGVNQGLLDVASSNAQLATVIGHEVAHVLARHGNERLTQELGIKAILYWWGYSARETETASGSSRRWGWVPIWALPCPSAAPTRKKPM